MRRAALALLLLSAPCAARADVLAAGLSTDMIQITSSFRGADVVVFGAVAADSGLGDLRSRDIVVVLRGPEVPLVVRKKERVFGIWVNTTEVTVRGFPSFLYLTSTGVLRQTIPPSTFERLRFLSELGIQHPSSDSFETVRDAVVRAKTRTHQYAERDHGVELLGSHLFRARLRLPASVPPGRYRAEVYLFSKGRAVAHVWSTLPIRKAGMERRLADYAQNRPIPYGLATVGMALALGWLGFAVFRRR